MQVYSHWRGVGGPPPDGSDLSASANTAYMLMVGVILSTFSFNVLPGNRNVQHGVQHGLNSAFPGDNLLLEYVQDQSSHTPFTLVQAALHCYQTDDLRPGLHTVLLSLLYYIG